MNIGGTAPASLLLVTTAPHAGSTEDRQGVLWGYRACGSPELLFAVSLGAGTSSYCPSVDARDGIVVAGRLTSSVALIDIPTAIKGWNNCMAQPGAYPALAVEPGGLNQRAIIQPF